MDTAGEPGPLRAAWGRWGLPPNLAAGAPASALTMPCGGRGKLIMLGPPSAQEKSLHLLSAHDQNHLHRLHACVSGGMSDGIQEQGRKEEKLED